MFIFADLFFIIALFAYPQVSAISCNISSSVTNGDSFPGRMLLSHGEIRKLSLKNYFIGVNITFNVNSTNNKNVTVRSKTQSQTDPFSFKDIITQHELGDVVDTFWDDSKVTDLMQNWTDISRVLFLTHNTSQGTSYSLLASSIANLKPSNQPNERHYTIIPLKPKNPGARMEMSCYRIINVGDMKYYVDCVSYDYSNKLNLDNFFILIEFDSPPPSTYKMSYVPNNLILANDSGPYPREMKSIKVQETQYLLRYYNGMGIPNIISTGIEVWDVTNLNNPKLTIYYNATDPNFPYVANISSIEVSKSFLYVISSEERVSIVSNWFSKPIEQKSYKFYEMTLRGSSLRIVSTSTGVKESLVVIGSVFNANFAGLLFVSQVYEGYYVIPVPSSCSQTSLQFKMNSLTVGEDFFVLSYAIAANYFENFCHYLAIFDISTQKSSYCHSLFPYDDSSMITYAKMSPAPGTDTLILFGKDNKYQYLSIYSPSLQINATATEPIHLLLGNVEGSPSIPLEIVVIPPNSTKALLRRSNSLTYTETVSKRNTLVTYPLNNSVCGPNMKFNMTFKDPIKSYQIIENKDIKARNLAATGRLFAARRNGINREDYLLLIQSTYSGAILNYGKMSSQSEFSISEIIFLLPSPTTMDLEGYFCVGGFDIYLLEDENSIQYLLFYNMTAAPNSIEGDPMRFNLTTVTHTLCYNVEIIAISDHQFSIACINHETLYIVVINVVPPNLMVAYSGLINKKTLNGDANFVPYKIKMHPAYPNTVFVLTTSKNHTYVVNYTNPATTTPRGSILSAYKVIFGIFTVNPNDEVFIQPFLNSFFFIVPRQNLIQHWDISNAKASYFRRNLDLYVYDITELDTYEGAKSIAFSTTTDTLYILAINTHNRVLNILVLKPNDANSHLIDSIQIPFMIPDSREYPFIDVTSFQKGLDSKLGDILCASTVNGYYFWEVYPTAYVVFEPQSPEGNFLNREIQVSVKAENSWDSLEFDLNFQVYQDQKGLCYANQSYQIVPRTSFSIDFDINNFVLGTIYNVTLYNEKNMNITLTSVFQENKRKAFMWSDVNNIWILKQNTYYLNFDRVRIHQNTGGKTITIPFVGSSLQCTKLYIERSETLGIALCSFYPKTGIIPFKINTEESVGATECNTTILSNFQGLAIDTYNRIVFILTRGEDEENDAIILYEFDVDGCIGVDPLLNIPGWRFAITELAFTKFDVVLFKSSVQAIQTNIFINDANFGLRIINFVKVGLQYKQIATFSYTELYKFYSNVPDNLDILDITPLETDCDQTREKEEICTISLLIVAKNFHSLLLKFKVINGDIIFLTNYSSFLVPQDYSIKNYQAAKDILILLGTNTSLDSPTLDMLVYNSSWDATSYSNLLQNNDTTLYKAPIWMQTLITDLDSYEDKIKESIENLRYPLAFLSDDVYNESLYDLYFPNMEIQQIINYTIRGRYQLSWDLNAYQTRSNISLRVMNNNEEIVFNISFDKEPRNTLLRILLILGFVLIITLVVGAMIYMRRRKEKMSYSRKKQKDPLRRLLVNS